MPGDKTPRTPFGAAVREKRRARGLSQCDLAEACGWSQAKLRVPSLMDVVQLAPPLEVDPSWLTMLAIQSLEAA
jgi:transcriptional regulator with XRE-family HTH domain